MNTSKTSVLIVMICATVSAYAQDEKQMKNDIEIGIIAFDYGLIQAPSQPAISSRDNDDSYAISGGLFIKKHTENKSYRMMLNYRTNSVAYQAHEFAPRDSLNTAGEYSRATISFGGERIFFKRKLFQFYWGMDLALLVGKYTGTTESTKSVYGYSASTVENGAGVDSFIGARFTMMDRIRLSVEPKFTALFYQQNEIKRNISTAHQMDNSKSFVFDNTPQVFLMVSYLF
jgi:hypothetical protein